MKLEEILVHISSDIFVQVVHVCIRTSVEYIVAVIEARKNLGGQMRPREKKEFGPKILSN